MKVLVAPDKFKGSLSAPVAAAAIARGFALGWPDCRVTQAPIADGGEGFAEIFQQALGGEWVVREVQDPLGRPVSARYAWVPAQRLAVLEMSEASGLWRLAPDELAPLHAHTYGTGQLLRHAAERGATRILVGLGGSATTDAGVGMAAALGYQFLGADAQPLPSCAPGEFAGIAQIDPRTAVPLPEIVAACDVTNPLLGERGTARIFAPQKGADAASVALLEHHLRALTQVVGRDLGFDPQDHPGAGAAGGFGYGLLVFGGATLRSGFDLVAETLGLEARIAECDLVITGEGRLDSQTLEGKGPAGVVALARRAGKPVLGLAGSVGEGAEGIFDATSGIIDAPCTLAQAMAAGEANLERTAARVSRLLRLGQRCSGVAPA